MLTDENLMLLKKWVCVSVCIEIIGYLHTFWYVRDVYGVYESLPNFSPWYNHTDCVKDKLLTT